MNKISKSIQYGNHTLTIETGEIARQATSVMVTLGETMVLVAVVAEKEPRSGRDFFPLTVHYIEKFYAAGKIPGGFLKREGRPTENETLVSRLIDRPLRPLFPKGFQNEIQVVATVMSMAPDVNPDIPAMIGASCAMALSGAPFNGPIAAARVGYKDGLYLLNPTTEELVQSSQLNLVVAGTKDAILMVESEAKELDEDIMLGGVLYGHEMMQSVIKMINDIVTESGRVAWDYQPPVKDETLHNEIKAQFGQVMADAYTTRDKQKRANALRECRQNVIAAFVTDAEGAPTKEHVDNIANAIEKNIVRERVLAGEPRIDGRDTKTVRPISIRTGLLPRAHGSALFTRGETQAIVTTTLGSERDSQMIDSIFGDSRDRFMLHYNFPPYCTGETGMMGSPKRREIGHGRLARRGLEAVLPDAASFPYAIRIVSEITESNGSSSMATVCGASLSLMDAGVPLKAPVAGIAMGLVKEGDRFTILTDILGDEDHLGDMDFKVAGTFAGVTALQMDIKIQGITKEIMSQALSQARDARRHILEIMNVTLRESKTEVSKYAPRIHIMKIPTDRIGDVIGKGGATIRSITEETGVEIDIADDGTIKIYSADEPSSKAAVTRIEQLTTDLEVGAIYEGTVTKIVDFGAFVNLLPGKDGLLHISQISHERINSPSDKLKEGQKLTVKVLDVDRNGRIKLSLKALQEGGEAQAPANTSEVEAGNQ